MKPIYQTIFDFEHGNCMQACVASIFELSLEEVPNFVDGGSFDEKINEWGSKFGVKIIDITCDDLDIIKDCWVIAVGKSPRSKSEKDRHAVVWYNGRIIHDPHPEKTGIKGDPEFYTIFIIKDPVEFKGNR